MRAFCAKQHQQHGSAAGVRSRWTQSSYRCNRRTLLRSSANDAISSEEQSLPGGQWSDLYSCFAASDKASTTAAPGSSSETNDSLTEILERLKQAAAAEDYATAAKLRDASLAYIGGWWRPVSSPQARGVNSSSSLLHVAHTEPDRWTGMLFTPADFMQFDLEGNCSASELQMSDMLQEARYGTPLFEVFVLPEQQHQQLQESSAMPAQAAAAGASQPASSSGGPSTGYRPAVVALQSVNRAFNELLGVQPARRKTAPTSTDGSRFINQRLLLMVQPHTVTAAAVHAGNSATLWTWHTNTTPSSTSTSSSNGGVSASPAAAAAASAAIAASDPEAAAAAGAESSAVQGPFRPAELSGGVRQGLTVDWHTIDHLRGPGTLQRTGTDTLTFCGQPLPADVLSVLCSSSSNGSSGGWDGSNARVFRVDLQYQLAPSAAEAAAPSEPDSSSSSSGASDPAASAAAVSESSVAAAAAAAAAVGGDDGGSWAVRVAAEVNSLLAAQPHAAAAAAAAAEEGGASQQQGSNSSSRLQELLAALLAAAAEGTAPPGGVVSEHQQAVSVVEVAVGDATAAAAPVEFKRVSEPTASLSFGGWQVTVCL